MKQKVLHCWPVTVTFFRNWREIFTVMWSQLIFLWDWRCAVFCPPHSNLLWQITPKQHTQDTREHLNKTDSHKATRGRVRRREGSDPLLITFDWSQAEGHKGQPLQRVIMFYLWKCESVLWNESVKESSVHLLRNIQFFKYAFFIP